MEVKIYTSDEFSRRAKKYAKKFKSFASDFKLFLDSIKENPYQGVDLGGGKRKLRMIVTSKNSGKRGGFRIITYNIIVSHDSLLSVYLLTIYDKSEFSSVSDSYINQIISSLK